MTDVVELIISILFVNIILLLIGNVIFVIVCIHKKDLFLYYPIYLLFLIGNIFVINQFVESFFRLVGVSFFMFTSLYLIFAAFLDYYKNIIKPISKKNYIFNIMIISVPLSSLIASIQTIMIVLMIISSILLFRIYLQTRSTVKALFMICNIVAIGGQTSQLNPYLDYEFGLLLSYLIGTIFITILVINSVVVILEKEIRKNIEIKDNLKDVYSHNLGNILTSLTLSYELIQNNKISGEELIEIYNMFKNKITEASEIVKEIRQL